MEGCFSQIFKELSAGDEVKFAGSVDTRGSFFWLVYAQTVRGSVTLLGRGKLITSYGMTIVGCGVYR